MDRCSPVKGLKGLKCACHVWYSRDTEHLCGSTALLGHYVALQRGEFSMLATAFSMHIKQTY